MGKEDSTEAHSPAGLTDTVRTTETLSENMVEGKE